MKAIVKITGEVVDVTPHTMMNISCASYKDKNGRILPSTSLEFEKQIDWEQRRYELAKDISCAYLQAHTNVPFLEIAKVSVKFADELITQLKEIPTINSD